MRRAWAEPARCVRRIVTGFGPIGNGKILLNGPFATADYHVQLTVFDMIVIAAIFGTSILRDFQRDTYRMPTKAADTLSGATSGKT